MRNFATVFVYALCANVWNEFQNKSQQTFYKKKTKELIEQIDCSQKPQKLLQNLLENDSEFEEFVSKMLEIIGFQNFNNNYNNNNNNNDNNNSNEDNLNAQTINDNNESNNNNNTQTE